MSPKTNSRIPRGIRSSAAGASLVELLIVLAITGVVTTGIYTFFLTTTQTNTDQAINARMLQTASNAMSLITRDLRQAGTFWATPCALLTPTPFVSANNASTGSITIRVLLDQPSARTEIAATPPADLGQINVVANAGLQKDYDAFITDGVKCTSFKIDAIAAGPTSGTQLITTKNINPPCGAGCAYPLGTSQVFRRPVEQSITYTIRTYPDDSNTPWLTRDTGSGARRLVPNVESLSFGYIMNDGTTKAVADVTSPADTANIGAVTVSLRVKADTRDVLLRDFRLQTLVATIKLRNLGS